MKTVSQLFYFVAVAMVACMGFVGCSKKEDVTVNLEGKWLLMTESYKELLVISADHSVLSTGADDEEAWVNVKGKIELQGNNFTYISEDGDNSAGTYTLVDNKFTLYIDGEALVYKKMLEDFSMVGSWKCVNTMPFIKAVKDELPLPFGSIVNGEEIPTIVNTANINGEFIQKAVEAYFRDVEFKSNGEMTYKVVKEGEEVEMTKNYELADNMMKITGKVGNIDINNQFMTFQNNNQTESYLFMTKENVADMFVGYGFMLREGNVSEGTDESLEAFKKSFKEVFENYAVVIYLQKQ